MRTLRTHLRRTATNSALRTLSPLVNGVVAALQHRPHARRRREGLEIYRDLPYVAGAGKDRCLDVYRDRRYAGPLPALLYVHGGGFVSCSKTTHIVLAIGWARRGFVVFTINYRLAPTNRYPAANDDTAAAIAWVQSHGARYGAQVDRLILAGESAGANLVTGAALSTAYELPLPSARDLFERRPAIAGVVAACGVFQVSDIDRLFAPDPEATPRGVRLALQAMTGAYLPRPDAAPGTYPLADPLLLVEGRAPARPLPPFFVFCGTADPLFPDSERLRDGLATAGADVTFRAYEGEPHGFHATSARPASKIAWKDQLAFVDHCLGAGVRPGKPAEATRAAS